MGFDKRINREKQTVEAMIKLSCNGRHHTKRGELCNECSKLLKYAHLRLDRCPFAEKKTVCAKCKIHCYKSDMKENIKEIMRYSGPKMIWIHPVLTIQHIVDQL